MGRFNSALIPIVDSKINPQNKWLNLATLLNAVKGLWNPFKTVSVCVSILGVIRFYVQLCYHTYGIHI